MGGDCRSWLPQAHFDCQSHNWNSFTAQLDSGKENIVTAGMNHVINTVPTNGFFPVSAGTKLPNYQPIGQTNEPNGWFHCLPQSQQAFNPVTGSTVRDKVSVSPYENCLEAGPTNAGSGCAEKRFLVFDQSADQTTLMFGSDSRNPMQFPIWIKQFPGIPGTYMNGAISGSKSDINHPLGELFTGKLDGKHDSDEVSEMHEDTEELNALLYSDDESDYNEADEVTSTGHSPGSVADHGKSNWLEGSTEDVASCNMPSKKRKVCDDNDADVQSLEDTASSSNPKRRTIECEDDVESTTSPRLVEEDSSSTTERMRKEKVKETIDILQRIVPNGKGKDAIVVLDEAIQYLKSLKLKAKALGLGTL